MTLAEIRELDAGYQFKGAPGQFPHRGQGLTVPTIEEVLSRFSTARLILERKEFTPALAVELCSVLTTREAEERVC